jgi:DNA-binding beta-propeller fold protein YncE
VGNFQPAFLRIFTPGIDISFALNKNPLHLIHIIYIELVPRLSLSMEELTMPHFKSHLGVIADFSSRRVSIFDTDTLTLLQHIPLEADVIDVALTSDCRRAVVTSFTSKTIFQVDLSESPAKVVGSATAATFLEDVQITPDDMFALSVDGSAANQNIVSYSLKKNTFVSTLATSAQAVAISPTCDSLVLTAVSSANSVRRFMINCCGDLKDTGQQFPAGTNPNNINFSPNGNFAFVVDFAGAVSVLSTVIPDQISLISTIPASSQPQSMVISRDGRHLFVLGSSNVDIFTFDPVSGSLVLARSFAHGLQITPFFGVDQIALDPSETRLFISATGQVAVFTTFGTLLGTVADVSGPGGLAICPYKCLN